MKKLLFTVFTALSFIGCSNSDDENTQTTNNPVATQYFHPPTWIQGKWQKDGTTLYKFTNDDFYTIAGSIETSYKSILQQGASLGASSSVPENISETVYEFTIKSGSTNAEYKFKKINSTKIEWVNYPYASTVGAFYLTKQ